MDLKETVMPIENELKNQLESRVDSAFLHVNTTADNDGDYVNVLIAEYTSPTENKQDDSLAFVLPGRPERPGRRKTVHPVKITELQGYAQGYVDAYNLHHGTKYALKFNYGGRISLL